MTARYSLHRRALLLAAPFALAQSRPANAQLAPDLRSSTLHQELQPALAMARDGRWPALSQLLIGLPPQSARVLLSDFGDLIPSTIEFGNLDSLPMGNTIIAAAQVGWAWRYRGRGVASTVTNDGFENFEKQLLLARSSVAQAINADPDDGIAHAIGFAANKGLSDKRALYSGLRGYLAAARRPIGGMSAFIDAVSGKWLGADSETLAFARQVSTIDLPASAAMIPDAHYANWSTRAMAHAAEDGPLPSFGEHLIEVGAHTEVLAANEAFLSVGPDPDSFANLHARARLSFALISLNESDRARPHIAALGDHIGGPWEVFEDPREVLDGVRRALGLEAL